MSGAGSMEIEVHPTEEVAWSQLSHLRDWLPNTESIHMTVPGKVMMPRVTDTMRLSGNLFHQLQHLKISISSAYWQITPALFGAASELLHLRSLHVAGGHLITENLGLHVLTGLRQLESLSVQPVSGQGLEDDHCVDGLSLLTGLTKLEFKGDHDLLTDVGVSSLSTLTRLKELSILPLGIEVTQHGLREMCQPLQQLEHFRAGFSHSRHVESMRGVPARVHHVSVTVADDQVEVSPFFTAVATSLESTLCSLRVTHSIHVEDAFFMVALGALTALTDLAVTIAPAKPTTPPFVLNMNVLAPLKHLQSLDFNVVGRRARLLVTPTIVSSLTSHWPELHHLGLSCMVPPQPVVRDGVSTGQLKGPLQPLALTQLGGFKQLRQLLLTAPLTEDETEQGDQMQMQQQQEEEELERRRSSSGNGALPAPPPVVSEEDLEPIPVALSSLPEGLEVLELEMAKLLLNPSESDLLQSRSSGGLGTQQAAEAAAGEGQEEQTRSSAVLPGKLKALALSQCEASDATLNGVFTANPHLTRLELHEVSGITQTSLRALSSLNLQHLDIVDQRDSRQLRKAASKHKQQPPAQQQAPSGGGWWGWLVGTPPPRPPPTPTTPAPAKAPLPRLCSADITALSALTTLKHLQWGVGQPLGLPTSALLDKDGHMYEEVADLSTGARYAFNDLRVAIKTVSALPDLTALYLDTLPRSMDSDDVWAEDLVEYWLHANDAPTPRTTIITGATSGATVGSRKPNATGDAAVAVEGGPTKWKRFGEGPVDRKAPRWLLSAVGINCECVGSLPALVAKDAWTGREYHVL